MEMLKLRFTNHRNVHEAAKCSRVALLVARRNLTEEVQERSSLLPSIIHTWPQIGPFIKFLSAGGPHLNLLMDLLVKSTVSLKIPLTPLLLF